MVVDVVKSVMVLVSKSSKWYSWKCWGRMWSFEGQRFNEETLRVDTMVKTFWSPWNSISDAAELQPTKIRRILKVIESMGLGYIQLGQPSTTISGGAQRIKLTTELQTSKGHIIHSGWASTGLHMADVTRLVGAMDQLIEEGHSLVIEHDLDIAKMETPLLTWVPKWTGGQLMGLVHRIHCHVGNSNRSGSSRSLLEYRLRSGLSNKYTRKVKHNNILVEQASTHNLKNIDVEIPKGEMTVITGPSGSGKSSLAFHTIFAEGQLRYIESLSTYARRFLGGMQRPPVNQIQGLTPAIAIDQSNRSRSPRSTVATSTKYDIYRLIFARAGIPHCHICPLEAHSPTKGAMLLKSVEEKLLLAKTIGQILVQHLLVMELFVFGKSMNK